MSANEVQKTIQAILTYEDAHPDWNTYPKPNKGIGFMESKFGWIYAIGILFIYTPMLLLLGAIGIAIQRSSKGHYVPQKDAPIYSKAKYLDAFADQLQAGNVADK